MDNKLNNFKNKNSSDDKILKRISYLLIVIIVLLILIFLKLDKMNKNFVIMSNDDSIEISTVNDDYNDVLDVFIEPTDNISDTLPLNEEISDISTSTTTEDISNNINEKETVTTSSSSGNSTKTTYVINKNSKKMHFKSCTFVSRMKEENKTIVQLDKQELNNYLNSGYSFCSTCGG